MSITMTTDIPWQDAARDALGFLAPPEDWREGEDGTLVLPEGDDAGWLVWNDGDAITMTWGCIEFQSDVDRDGDIAYSARRLIAAAAAWDLAD